MTYRTTYNSPIGTLTLACDGTSLVGIWIEGQRYHGDLTLRAAMIEREDLPVFDATKKWLDAYFGDKRPSPTELPLAPVGTEFRQMVWQILCEIPYGKTITYREIARQVAKKLHRAAMSSQAVGGAVGHNPISIIIPCHRVVGTGGSLTGYAGGVSTKLKLLEHEKADTAKLFMPKPKKI